MDSQDRDELNERLKKLAKDAQHYPPQSKEHRRAIGQLIHEILQPGRLYRPYSENFPLNLYEDILEEAKQRLVIYISKNIHKYDPKRSPVLAWVNVLLERRFIRDVISEIKDTNLRIIRAIEDLDRLVPPQEDSLVSQLFQCLEEDRQNVFKNERMKKHPKVSFQVLALRRLSGKSWQEISAEFGIEISSGSSFYQRCVAKFADKLRSDLQK